MKRPKGAELVALLAIVDDLENQPQARLGISVARDEPGRREFVVGYEFGREAPDSPMYAGASYGAGATLGAALEQVKRECRL